MRFLFFLLCISSIFLNCSHNSSTEQQKSFEGVIEYNYTYHSDSMNIDSLKAQRPSKGKMIYKDSMYKSMFFGKDTAIYIYDNNSGISYNFSEKNDSIDCEGYKTNSDTVSRFEIMETNEKILGQKVKILEFDSKYATNRFFYSLTHKVAPFNYDKHLAYNWKFYKEKTNGGVLLKVEHIFKKFTMIGIATKIEAKTVSESEFVIDKTKLKNTCP